MANVKQINAKENGITQMNTIQLSATANPKAYGNLRQIQLLMQMDMSGRAMVQSQVQPSRNDERAEQARNQSGCKL